MTTALAPTPGKGVIISLSVGMDSAGMTVYAIDQASGELQPTGHYAMGTQPNWIEIVDLK